MVYVDKFQPTQKEWDRLVHRIDASPSFKHNVDIWLDEITRVDSMDYNERYSFFTLQNGENGEKKRFFLRYWDIKPTHSNPFTRYYIDDLYSFDSLRPTLRKDRTNIIKYIQQFL